SKICWPAATKREKYLAAARLRIADIDKRFVDSCLRITERAQDPSPVWVAAAPADLHECAVSDCARGRFRLCCIARTVNMEGNEARSAFAVAHNHFRQLQTSDVERRLKKAELRVSNLESRISGEPIRQRDYGIVGAHVAINRDAIETLRDCDSKRVF